MSHGTTVFRVFDRPVRQNHRSQPDWFRCTKVERAVECWHQALAGGRYADHVTTFEPSPRRRSLPKSVGHEAWW